MKIVLPGTGGLLGTAFRAALAERAEILTLDTASLRPEAADQLESVIVRFEPDIILNCAAHTDLEAAEASPEQDRIANADLPSRLARLAGTTGATMIHFSSTGCYGTWKDTPYTERDAPEPTTAHHRAKLEGERLVANSGCRHLIFRTGWLYGGEPDQPKNFVWKRLLEARRSEELRSDAVQRGCPTLANDVVDQVLTVMQAGATGLFNLTAHGNASRWEYVSKIVEFAGLPCKVIPGPAFQRLAPVSFNEAAVNERLSAEGLDHMPDWQDALRGYVQELIHSPQWTKKVDAL